MAYDSPNANITREISAGEAGGAATTEYCRNRVYQKGILRAVHAVVTTAGTATAHALNVYVGTTSVGAITLSTSTAGVSASSGALDTAFTSLEALSVKTGADATGTADVVYEYDVDHDATQTG